MMMMVMRTKCEVAVNNRKRFLNFTRCCRPHNKKLDAWIDLFCVWSFWRANCKSKSEKKIRIKLLVECIFTFRCISIWIWWWCRKCLNQQVYYNFILNIQKWMNFNIWFNRYTQIDRFTERRVIYIPFAAHIILVFMYTPAMNILFAKGFAKSLLLSLLPI